MSSRSTHVALLALVLFCLGTSKPLAYKRAPGTVRTLPTGITSSKPSFFIGENVNNQGCGVDQRLDLRVELTLKNATKTPVVLREQDATVSLGTRRFAIKRQYATGAKYLRRYKPLRSFTIAPGQTAKVQLEAYSFVSLSSIPWNQIDRVEVSWPLRASDGAAKGTMALRLDGLKALPLLKR
jgi:hypothetical protein